jgi:hypothetical protein
MLITSVAITKVLPCNPLNSASLTLKNRRTVFDNKNFLLQTANLIYAQIFK